MLRGRKVWREEEQQGREKSSRRSQISFFVLSEILLDLVCTHRLLQRRMIVEESSNLFLVEVCGEKASTPGVDSEEVASLLKPAKEGILAGLVED